jgi:putative membrane protein
MMLVFWGGLAAIVVVLVRSGRDRDVKKDGEDATDVLRRRYADGEISREEFDEKRHVLETTRR